MKLNSLYVTARDYDRAVSWYRDTLFGRSPDSTTDRFAFWDLDGVKFGVFNPEITGAEVEFGDNCVPNIEVDDVDDLHDRLCAEGVEVVMDLKEVNGTRIFQVRDSEKNVLEFYAWTQE